MASRIEAIKTRALAIKKLDARIATTDKRLKDMKARKKLLQTEALDFLKKEDVDSIKIKGWNVARKEVDVPIISDFQTFWKHVKKNNAPELMNRTVNAAAWRENDENVPGIGAYTRVSLSITKRRK